MSVPGSLVVGDPPSTVDIVRNRLRLTEIICRRGEQRRFLRAYWEVVGHKERLGQPTVVGGGLCVAGRYRVPSPVVSSVGFSYLSATTWVSVLFVSATGIVGQDAQACQILASVVL